jgi:DNA-directed RNA polymerase sigma subunit (sigma70/sigma32)
MMTYKEIAKELELTEEQVRTAERTGLRKIKILHPEAEEILKEYNKINRT